MSMFSDEDKLKLPRTQGKRRKRGTFKRPVICHNCGAEWNAYVYAHPGGSNLDCPGCPNDNVEIRYAMEAA